MSEELLQRNLLEKPEKIGHWDFYNIGATSLKSLKENNIIPKIDYKIFSKRKPDGIIVHKKKVLVSIENKKPSELNTKKKVEQIVKKGLEVAKALKAKVLIVTDTKKSIWLNALNGEIIKDEFDNPIKKIFNPWDENTAKYLEQILNCIDESNSQIVPPQLKDPTPLAKQIWQDVWSVSGATPENCLYTFVELFIFKYLSDLGVLQGIYSFESLIKMYDSNSEEEVLEHYANTIRKKIKESFPGNPKDNTTIINGTIFVSKDEKAVQGYSGVFKKTLEKFEKEGRLENIHHDFKSKLFESFLKESISKKNWGQFFTPLKVVRAIVNMADIKAGMKICDPACGVGKFLLEPILKKIKTFFQINKQGNLIPKIDLLGYDKGFDKDEQKTIILAKANMLIYFSDLIKENPNITQQFAQLFNNTFELKTNSILGTLAYPITNEFDLILTNPPYVTSGSSNLKEEIRKSSLEYHYPINGRGYEGLFMEWIIRALKPNGKAFIVVPDGLLIGQDKIKKFIRDECFIEAIISLPPKTFFTTIKKTYILVLTKKSSPEEVQIEPIFTYLVSDIGETLDVYRFETEVNHLNEAVILFNQFKGAKKDFKTSDKRCKIQPVSLFNPGNHWAIDRWWKDSEKVELGIKDEVEKMNLNDFSALLEDISNSLISYQDEIKEIEKKIEI